MNENYIYEYSSLLERVFSYAHKNLYSTSAIEKSIAYSSFFQSIEKSGASISKTITENKLIESVFNIANLDSSDVPQYNQCLWAAEAYLRIQLKTKLTFECIFLFLPIKKMYEMFDLYHEMDFSQTVQCFNDIFNSSNTLSKLLENNNITITQLSKETGISVNSLYSLKTKRRNISAMDVLNASKIASFFRVRIETLACIPQ